MQSYFKGLQKNPKIVSIIINVLAFLGNKLEIFLHPANIFHNDYGFIAINIDEKFARTTRLLESSTFVLAASKQVSFIKTPLPSL